MAQKHYYNTNYMKQLMTVKDKEIKDLQKDLTPKQRAFLKLYFETGNATQSALKVYDTDNISTAGAIASENLQKLKNPIQTFMESKGLSLGSLVEKVKEGTDATRATNAAILVQKDGSVVKAEEQGLIEVPDYLTRHKYIETAAKWLGVEREEVNQSTTAIQVNIHPAFLNKYGNI